MSGLPRLLVCGTPSTALDAVLSHGDAAAALIVPGEGTFTVAQMTHFGPLAREYPVGDRNANLVSIARQTLRREALGTPQTTLLSLWCASRTEAESVAEALSRDAGEIVRMPGVAGPGPDGALEKFLSTRPEAPTRTGPDGDARGRTWSLAPLADPPFSRGDSLVASVDPSGSNWVVRWRGLCGTDAGVHVVLRRPPTEEERETVRGARAVVLDAIMGSMPLAGGRQVVQTLVLDVPEGLTHAFPDGRLPAHGGLEDARDG